MKSRFGFSMLEILISLVILSFGFLPIYNLFRQGSATTVNNIQENIATNYASDMINLCKDLKYYQIKDATDNKDTYPLEEDAKIIEFFQEHFHINAPPKVEEPFKRSITFTKFDHRSLSELWRDIWENRKKVPSYMVKVVVTFPRMSGKGNDDVTLYSLIMD